MPAIVSVRAFVTVVALAAACACSTGGARPAAEPVPALPDLTAQAPSVQTQLRDHHARVVAAAARASATEQSNAFGELGMLLLAAQFADAPAAFLSRAESLAPSDHRWPYYLAHYYRQRGEPDRARAAFERASALNPQDVASLVWLGDTLLQLDQSAPAAARFTAALAVQPTSLSARFGLGRAALATGDAPTAIAHFQAVLTQDPTAAAVHYPLSQAFTAVGDTAQAARHLALRASHEILPADPLMVALETVLESPQSYETRGIRALEAKDWTGAVAAFRHGLTLAPNNAALHHRLGAALNMTGDRAGARSEFEEAVRLSPEQFLAFYSLGVLDQEDARHEDAVTRFTAALAVRPSYAPARLRRAASLRRTGRAAEALAEYRRVTAEEAGQSEAHIGHAMTLVQLGRDREAKSVLERALAAEPASAAFQHALARLLSASRDAAVRDGQRARQMVDALVAQGRSLDLGETLAMALAELGEFPRAVAVQTDLLTAARSAGLPMVVARLSQNLARYERGTPCRVPWTEAEWP